ncbi:MAG: phospholipase [Formosa sp.]|nr:phospholipase [Formosa sp.]|tara:strand:+ start:18560 stop:19213 length:654 start_codon:yes stop_codon:yes gene_type:complete
MSEPLPLVSVVRKSILSSKAPVLVLLHGYGSNENDLFSFAAELPKELCIIALRAPYSIEPYGHAWYAINFDSNLNKRNDVEQAKESMAIIMNCVNSAQSLYDTDPSNISLLGFSQGCILSIALALNHPEKFKNIIGLSGYICKEFLNDHQDEKAYKHLNFYCSHGSSDQVIPVEWARETPKHLESLGIKNHYSEFPVGHGVAPENFFEFKQWLIDRI